jgi:hypothetical protein
MRAFLTCLLIGCAGPALAMNWEGHDDWMADKGPAMVYEQAVPHAILVPDASACADAPPVDAANPYEQVPLERHDCRTPAESPDSER